MMPTLAIRGQPDMAICVGPPDTIAMGSPTVQIEMMPAARVGDPTMHGGVITIGCPTVMIGMVGMGGAATTDGKCMSSAKKSGAPFVKPSSGIS